MMKPRIWFVCFLIPLAVAGCRAANSAKLEPGAQHGRHNGAPHGAQAGTQQGGHDGANHEGHRHGSPRNLAEYIAAMEQPGRARWQKPEEVLAALKLRPGETVADVGCGPGYFTLPIAQAVAPTGKVWAVDIEPKMLDRLREHLTERNVSNVECVAAEEDDPLLPKGRIDTILIVDTYHHFSNRVAYVGKLRAALTPAGRIVIIDFVPKSREERGFGPPKSMQLSRAAVDGEMAEAGLLPLRVHDFLPEQYFVEYHVASEPVPGEPAEGTHE